MNKSIARPVGKKNQKKVECFIARIWQGQQEGEKPLPETLQLPTGSLSLLQLQYMPLLHRLMPVLLFLCLA